MRLFLISLTMSALALAEPTTRPSLESLRPHTSEAITVSTGRLKLSRADPASAHYVYFQPTAYPSYGYGWYFGWGGWFYP